MKPKKKFTPSSVCIARLDATLSAAEDAPERFNNAIWVRGTKNGKHAEIDFACLAIDLFGDAKERSSMTCDGSYLDLGEKILELDSGTARRLFWGGNNLEDIKGIIAQLKEESLCVQ